MIFKKISIITLFGASVLFASAEVKTNPAPEVQTGDYARYIEDANNDNAAAARIIGDCYLTGRGGVGLDAKQAWKWYAKAAGKGDLEARYRIGCLYRDGLGVKRNDGEAAYWFGRAAANGHSLAQLNIADCYANGRGIQMDQRIASENYWRAADRGVAEAQYIIAGRLRDGIGITADPSMALKFFSLAAEAGFPDADVQARRLEEQGVKMPSKTVAAKSTRPVADKSRSEAPRKKDAKASSKKKDNSKASSKKGGGKHSKKKK